MAEHKKEVEAGLSVAEARRLLDYDKETGLFTWKVDESRKIRAGKKAGSSRPNGAGYIRIGIFERSFLAHRVAWAIVYGSWPYKHIDHINGVRNDNRISNLREASRSQNQMNACLRKSSTSGVKGVYRKRGTNKWVAEAYVNRRAIHLGVFDCIDAAAEVATTARKLIHGEFFRHE